MPTVSSKDLAANKQWQSTSATDTTLIITVDPTAPPKLGATYQFRLEVFDDSGNKSQPVTAQVTIVDTVAPTAVVTPTTQKVNVTQGFTLSGASSTDTGGGDNIAKYVWTLVQFQ